MIEPLNFTTSDALRGAKWVYLQVNTMGSKWEIKMFSIEKKFWLWNMDMKEILTQERCIEALISEASMHEPLIKSNKTEMMNNAKSSIILCLRYKILKEVNREKKANSMWEKLESSYMT